MIKIPKSLDELKAMISDVQGDKRQEASDAAPGLAKPTALACELNEVLTQLKQLRSTEEVLWQRLGVLTHQLQQQVEALAPVIPPPACAEQVVSDCMSTETAVSSEPLADDEQAVSTREHAHEKVVIS